MACAALCTSGYCAAQQLLKTQYLCFERYLICLLLMFVSGSQPGSQLALRAIVETWPWKSLFCSFQLRGDAVGCILLVMPSSSWDWCWLCPKDCRCSSKILPASCCAQQQLKVIGVCSFDTTGNEDSSGPSGTGDMSSPLGTGNSSCSLGTGEWCGPLDKRDSSNSTSGDRDSSKPALGVGDLSNPSGDGDSPNPSGNRPSVCSVGVGFYFKPLK